MLRQVFLVMHFLSQIQDYFSYEEKSMKPNVSIYRAIEKISGKSGNQIAFIDDNIENIEGAIQLGWSAQQHVSFESTKDFFRNLGLI